MIINTSNAIIKYIMMDVSSMKPKTMATVAIVVTAMIMGMLLFCIMEYIDDPENVMWLAGMSMLSSGLILFLLIFALVYTRPTNAERFEELRKKME